MGHVPFGDVGEVVATLQHAMVVEIEFLHRTVSIDGRIEGRPQNAPFLMILLPWLDLLTGHSLGREEKGRREVIPEGIPDEIKVLEIVPRCVSFVAFIGGARRRQLLDHRSGVSLNPDFAFLVDPALSPLRERHDEGTWSASVNLDESGAKPIRMLLDLEEITAER
jgi:hypothetical protein